MKPEPLIEIAKALRREAIKNRDKLMKQLGISKEAAEFLVDYFGNKFLKEALFHSRIEKNEHPSEKKDH